MEASAVHRAAPTPARRGWAGPVASEGAPEWASEGAPERSAEQAADAAQAAAPRPALPPGACDCHTHVFADPAVHPFSPQRSYTPGLADAGLLARHLGGLGLDRVVVVQPSVYGLDNGATLAAIAALGPGAARGVAAIDADTASDAQLDALAAGGMRGVRLNFETDGMADPAQAERRMRAAAARVGRLGWHVQLHVRLALAARLAPAMEGLGVPVVLDHYAGTAARTAPDHPDFVRLLAALRSGNVYVKLSAGHLCAIEGDDFSPLEPLARALIAARPDRLVWGSDWPHPDPGRAPGRPAQDITPLKRVDDAGALAVLARCAPDARTLEDILVANPARLYGFDTPVQLAAPPSASGRDARIRTQETS